MTATVSPVPSERETWSRPSVCRMPVEGWAIDVVRPAMVPMMSGV